MFRSARTRSFARGLAVAGALSLLPMGAGAHAAEATTAAPSPRAAATTTAPARPFGSHPVPYAPGAAQPPGGAAKADTATLSAYTAWKSRYLVAGCGDGRYYVDASSSTASRVVSEGQGYGMVVVALMAGADPTARTEFDGLFRYAKDHPSEVDGGLMAWHQGDDCASIPGDAGSATDGDLDIAFGLLLADRQWGSRGAIDYRAEALKTIGAIKRSEINPTTHLTKLGDWPSRSDSAHWFATRSSDFMTDHFLAFQHATGDTFWGQVITATDALIGTMQKKYAPVSGLLPDFIVSTNTTAKPAPANFQEGEDDGAHSWNACRDPWRLASNALVGNDAVSRAAVQKMTAWIRATTKGSPTAVRAGYRLHGTALVSYGDPAFTAPFAAAAMVDSGSQPWLNALWPKVSSVSSGYFADSIALQSLLLISNNVWLP